PVGRPLALVGAALEGAREHVRGSAAGELDGIEGGDAVSVAWIPGGREPAEVAAEPRMAVEVDEGASRRGSGGERRGRGRRGGTVGGRGGRRRRHRLGCWHRPAIAAGERQEGGGEDSGASSHGWWNACGTAAISRRPVLSLSVLAFDRCG